MKKKLISLALALVMVLSLFSVTAFATDSITYLEWDDSQKKLVEKSTTDYTEYIDQTDLASGIYVVKQALSIDNPITVNGTVESPTYLIVCDGARLWANQGITVAADNALVICGQSEGEGAGQLYVSRNYTDPAGISGGINGEGGIVTVNGGRVGVSGGFASSNGGSVGFKATLTVNGGYASVSGGDASTQGPGGTGMCGTLTVNGGTATVIGGKGGMGGNGGTAIEGTLTVNGGAAVITAGNSGVGGSGGTGVKGKISITGKNATAKVTGGEGKVANGVAFSGNAEDFFAKVKVSNDDTDWTDCDDFTVISQSRYLQLTKGHVHTPVQVNTKAATCTENGVKNAYWQCSDTECGKCFKEETCINEITEMFLATDYIAPALGHWFITEEPVDNGDGTHSYKCENEGCEIVGTMDGKEAYPYDKENGEGFESCEDKDNDHKCDVCGHVMSECKDETGDGFCDICGKDLTEPEPVPEVPGFIGWIVNSMLRIVKLILARITLENLKPAIIGGTIVKIIEDAFAR